MFFFFKQKTAYELRISDWSSDVCSSDLKMRLEDVRLAIAVYDLKTKEGKVYPEIANELGLDGGDKGTGSDRAKDLFKTAATWIKRAEDPMIWMRDRKSVV